MNKINSMRKLYLFIACSLDGYIAKENNDLSFLKLVEKDGEDYGYQAFIETVDTIVLGRKTYDYVIQMVGANHYQQGDQQVYVLELIGSEAFEKGLVQLHYRRKR